jgi:hypothetical protein
VTAETITPENDGITPCDNWGAVSSRTGPECDHQAQLDHLDTMLHHLLAKVGQLDPLVPLIPRALALLDPGAAMRRTWKRGRADAVPQREAASFHVGEASEDRPPMGA